MDETTETVDQVESQDVLDSGMLMSEIAKMPFPPKSDTTQGSVYNSEDGDRGHGDGLSDAHGDDSDIDEDATDQTQSLYQQSYQAQPQRGDKPQQSSRSNKTSEARAKPTVAVSSTVAPSAIKITNKKDPGKAQMPAPAPSTKKSPRPKTQKQQSKAEKRQLSSYKSQPATSSAHPSTSNSTSATPKTSGKTAKQEKQGHDILEYENEDQATKKELQDILSQGKEATLQTPGSVHRRDRRDLAKFPGRALGVAIKPRGYYDEVNTRPVNDRCPPTFPLGLCSAGYELVSGSVMDATKPERYTVPDNSIHKMKTNAGKKQCVLGFLPFAPITIPGAVEDFKAYEFRPRPQGPIERYSKANSTSYTSPYTEGDKSAVQTAEHNMRNHRMDSHGPWESPWFMTPKYIKKRGQRLPKDLKHSHTSIKWRKHGDKCNYSSDNAPYCRLPAFTKINMSPEFVALINALWEHFDQDLFTRDQLALYTCWWWWCYKVQDGKEGKDFCFDPQKFKPYELIDLVPFIKLVQVVIRCAEEDGITYYPNLMRAVDLRKKDEEKKDPEFKKDNEQPYHEQFSEAARKIMEKNGLLGTCSVFLPSDVIGTVHAKPIHDTANDSKFFRDPAEVPTRDIYEFDRSSTRAQAAEFTARCLGHINTVFYPRSQALEGKSIICQWIPACRLPPKLEVLYVYEPQDAWDEEMHMSMALFTPGLGPDSDTIFHNSAYPTNGLRRMRVKDAFCLYYQGWVITQLEDCGYSKWIERQSDKPGYNVEILLLPCYNCPTRCDHARDEYCATPDSSAVQHVDMPMQLKAWNMPVLEKCFLWRIAQADKSNGDTSNTALPSSESERAFFMRQLSAESEKPKKSDAELFNRKRPLKNSPNSDNLSSWENLLVMLGCRDLTSRTAGIISARDFPAVETSSEVTTAVENDSDVQSPAPDNQKAVAFNPDVQSGAFKRKATDTPDNTPIKRSHGNQPGSSPQTSALTANQQTTAATVPKAKNAALVRQAGSNRSQRATKPAKPVMQTDSTESKSQSPAKQTTPTVHHKPSGASAETTLKNALSTTKEGQLGLWDEYNLDIKAVELPSADRGPTLQDPERSGPEPCPKAVRDRINAALSMPKPEESLMESCYEEYMAKVAKLRTSRAACSWIDQLHVACEMNFELAVDAIDEATKVAPLESLPESTPERVAKRSMAWDLYQAWRTAYIHLLNVAVALRRMIRLHLGQPARDESKTLTLRRNVDPRDFELKDILEGLEVKFPAGRFSHIEIIDNAPDGTVLIELTRLDGQPSECTMSSLLQGQQEPSPEPTASMLRRRLSEPPEALRPLKFLRTLERDTSGSREPQPPQDLELIDLGQATRFITRRDLSMALARNSGIEQPEEWHVRQMRRVKEAIRSAVDTLSEMDPSDLKIPGHELIASKRLKSSVYSTVREVAFGAFSILGIIKDNLERLKEEGREVPSWVQDFLLNDSE